MMLNVMVSDDVGGAQKPLLVTPFGDNAAIPEHLTNMHWRSLATAGADDRLLRARRQRIEAEIACRGYSLVPS